MHHDHDHHHDDPEFNGHAGDLASVPPGPGHNHARSGQRPAQWQTPHKDHGHNHHHDHGHGEGDIDLVEAAFVQGFTSANDLTSFLRLACIPFKTRDADGVDLVLLRVETKSITDVGGVSPQLGGGSFRYDPLPARLVSHRRRLRFIYFDGSGLRAVPLAAVRALPDMDNISE